MAQAIAASAPQHSSSSMAAPPNEPEYNVRLIVQLQAMEQLSTPRTNFEYLNMVQDLDQTDSEELDEWLEDEENWAGMSWAQFCRRWGVRTRRFYAAIGIFHDAPSGWEGPDGERRLLRDHALQPWVLLRFFQQSENPGLRVWGRCALHLARTPGALFPRNMAWPQDWQLQSLADVGHEIAVRMPDE